MTIHDLPPLPLGISAFSNLRKHDAVYVDKTAQIFSLCRNVAKVFLARPRRFGKTLLVSTFESLFRFGARDFSGLAIEGRWTDCAYPVVRLDFSLAKDFRTFEEFDALLNKLLARALKLSGLETPSVLHSGSESALDAFIDVLSAAEDGSIVLLIDEYDAPLTAHLDDPVLFSQVQMRLSQLYTAIKAFDGCLRFFFMTGVTKLSNTGIFSGFNNLQDISLVPEFGALLGYTEEEIRESFELYLRRAAEELQNSEEEIIESLRSRYNGFCFEETAERRVFCPWSVLNFLQRPSRGFRNYWYESAGHPALLMKYLANHRLADPASFAQPVKVPLADLSSSQLMSDIELEVLLFQAGYLTIRSVNSNGLATLGYPNEEVAQSLAQLYAQELLGGKAYDAPDNPTLSELLAAGTLDEIAGRFNAVFNAIDYQRYPVKDEAACRAFLQVLMMGADMVPNVEVHTAHGRSDLEVRAGGRRWVFEIKFAGTEADVPKLLAEGAAQMKDRQYGETPAGLNAEALVRAVMVFSREQRRFVRWQMS